MKKLFYGVLMLFSVGANAQKIDNKGKAEMYAGVGLVPIQSILSLDGNSNANMQITDVLSVFIGGDFFTGKYFAVGGQLNYYNNKYTSSNPSGQIYNRRNQVIATMVRLRANWISRKNFSLYSSFALGTCVIIQSEPISLLGKRNATVYPAYQWSYVGIRVGGDAAFFAEFGNGFQGFISAGFSARF